MKTKSTVIAAFINVIAKLCFVIMLSLVVMPAAAQTIPAAETPVTFGQLTKGSFNITGSVGYTSTGTSTTTGLTPYSSSADSVSVPNGKTSSFTFSINPGYLIADGFQLNLSLGYTNATTLVNQQAYTNNEYYSWNNVTNTYQLGLGATKYWVITHKLYFKAGLTVYYNPGNVSSSFLTIAASGPYVMALPEQTTNGYQATISTGIEYFPSARWGINFNFNNIVNYTSVKVNNVSYQLSSAEIEETQNRTTNTLTAGAGLTPSLAVRYTVGNIRAKDAGE